VLASRRRTSTQRESKLLAPSAERFVPETGAALNWFADGYEESIARQVKTGYVQADPADPTIFSPTVQGAFAMTWAQLPPMKQMGLEFCTGSADRGTIMEETSS